MKENKKELILMAEEIKVAIVSGGSRGLGYSIVKDLLNKGYKVATFSRASNKLIDNLIAENPNEERFLWRRVDATDKHGVSGFIRDVVKKYGNINVLINNAGIGIEGILTTMSEMEIDSGIALNFTSAVYLTRACIKSMLGQKSGCIINISSVNALRGHKGLSVYSATKAALHGMTISLAREFGSQNIRINCIAPGFFESDMSAHLQQEKINQIIKRTPLKKLCTIDDIVKTVNFLIETQSITGQTIVVDGGFCC